LSFIIQWWLRLFILKSFANVTKEQWWWMMKCNWSKKVGASLCCGVLLISCEAFGHLCVVLLWRNSLLMWNLWINGISISLCKRLLIPKKRQVDVDILLLIRIVVVDHFVVMFLCCLYPQMDAYYTKCNWLVVL
jgi:hypothetical protein